ncbi:MAG: hypothetical protein E7121_07270 [Bacteroidales bacterium]|nr:hypothetical protein [Bacteroidales bacterium]
MKKLFLLFCLVSVLFGCQTKEFDVMSDTQIPMKKVALSAGMVTDTKASVDSQTGAFSWQAGDVISVLATDGKFYDFVLASGMGEREAEFTGSIPETAEVTTVATYPVIADNGADNTVLVGTTLSYTLAAEFDYVKDVCNVPMVAAFGEAATHMAFKQIGGVMRFPVKNLPTEAKLVITMKDKTVTGAFPVDINNLGTACMNAGEVPSVVTINYSSEIDGAYAEFNVPVPVGVYNNFTLTIKDAEDNVLFTKEYSAENKVNRATLLNMKEIVLPERPMVISEVWPFFVDARVVFNKYEGVDKYAFYVDGADEPVILAAEDLGDKAGALIGGGFAHKSTHSVAVAKVVDDKVVAESKSEAVEFTTGRVMQMTYNTGTKFICAGWDDVAIGIENSTVYDEATKKWSLVPVNDEVNGRNIRGYRVQLYAEDKSTLLYDEVPFSGQVDYGGAISSSSWIGKIGGENVLLPTALSFGWLEPGKKYYFRVQTLAESVTFNSPETGYFNNDGGGVTLTSPRGGCGWSEFVEMTTDAAHVASENEVLFEGFDDMMHNSDIMNVAPAAVPQFLTEATTSGNYKSTKSAALYQAWADKPFAERKFSEQGFNTMLGIYYLGMTDDATTTKNVPSVLNKYAGSLEGWSVVIGADGKPTRTLNPNFGSVRLGESGTASGKVTLRTAPIMSDKLSEDMPTKCIITAKVSGHATTKENVNAVLGIYHYRGDVTIDDKNTVQINLDENGAIKPEWSQNYTWTDKNNYIHYPTWFEVKTELYLLKGDVIGFEKANPTVNGEKDFYDGCMTIGEIKIEVAPKEPVVFEDNGIGTEPDDTDYDVYNMGEFPISFWWAPPTANATYDNETTKAVYKTMQESGINVVNYVGELDLTLAENIRIMNICTDLGMKFIGQVGGYATNEERVAAIKEHLATSDTYVAEHLCDEPGADEFDRLAEFANLYAQEIPNKDVYVNLFPDYANVATQLKTTSYENYLDSWLQKGNKNKFISYDYYGLMSAAGQLKASYFKNLDMVRSRTLELRKPYWVITQSGNINSSTRQPNEKEQRWCVWSSIAIGSKGISYFCYWTPVNFPDYMVKRDGTTTEMYNWIKQLNADINTIGKKLLHCHADGAIMTATKYYPLYDNNGVGRTKYGPIQAVSGTQSILCGCFRDARRSENGENYKGYKALVVSEMANRTVDAYLTLDASVTKITVTHNNTSAPVDLVDNMSTTVGKIGVAYLNGQLTLSIPDGEAALIEF